MRNNVSQWFLHKTKETGKFIVNSTTKKRTENYANSFQKIDSRGYESSRGT
ncbi:hypothetical protein [Aquimarina macrocephali]|uniref:hypothetical protein n=1 Tax=Aquimarina macrocephali TaxID=666563 RepID=UPI0004B3A654|nr:hypothetical protein [Aquimarina macrocephali]